MTMDGVDVGVAQDGLLGKEFAWHAKAPWHVDIALEGQAWRDTVVLCLRRWTLSSHRLPSV